ncbi:TonB-dependent receptor [Calothrix sp. UHCC 0171]|uniref:TonB-dependent receptor n=1 Tax=Calothrix sp. UHCC 0171 TaxID=3110245 RepID=UPI002B2018C3|nr:TonB-dependent receptor [Calothrix sp. UHCC 0171]MEA5572538.1 TonB-dependent receptor [Calothrix sp. UHCC 0171]
MNRRLHLEKYQVRVDLTRKLILSDPNLMLLGMVAGIWSVIFSPLTCHAEGISKGESRENRENIDVPVSFLETNNIQPEEVVKVVNIFNEYQPAIDEASIITQNLNKLKKNNTQSNLKSAAPDFLDTKTYDTNTYTVSDRTTITIEQTEQINSSIQPFQPDTKIKLPTALEKLSQNQDILDSPTTSPVVTENNSTSNTQPPTSPVTPTQTSVKILTPTQGRVIDIPATTVVLQFTTGSEIELRVNGELVDQSLIGRTETDGDVVTQTWYGVPLKDGENQITAQIQGITASASSVKVRLRGAPEKMSLETREARVPADGRSLVNITGQLLDGNGNRSHRDLIVTLAATAGEFVGNDFQPDVPGFQVQAQKGEFKAQLKSGLNAQTVRIRAYTGNLEAFTQVQFATALRPSLVTGVIDIRLGARSTDYFGSLRDFLRPRPETTNKVDRSTRFDVRSSVFTTGAIGEWLFTGAYNSDRNLNEDCNCDTRLFRNYQFDEQNYPVYGDSSRIDVITPSIDSVFARLERSSKIPGAAPDYIMWGDYNTEEFARTSQQFTSFTRQLHGLKLNYNLGNLQFTGLYGNNVEGFQRDTIPPDGTSGFYFLSRRLVQPGSEVVFIESEELNRPGTIIQRQRLNIGQDYQIDYDRGTILFTEPQQRTDIGENGEVLVRRIIVTYQQKSEDSEGDIYAGRLQYNIARGANQDSWIAASYLQESQGTRDFELYGADAIFSWGNNGRFIAEYARSQNTSDIVGAVSGEALRVEAEGQVFPGIQARAYYRFADTGFANNATISFVPGQTRYGAQVTGKVTHTTNLRFQYDHEDNFGIAPQPLDSFEELFAPRTTALPGGRVDNSLTTISAGIQQRFGQTNLDFDWVHRDREDRISDTFTGSSQQLRSRLSFPITKRLTFLAQNELTLSSQVDAVYPDRTALGLNWALTPGVNLTLSQQFYTQGQFDGQAITSLGISGEHKLGADTTITGRYSILGAANEMTTQGAIGINNRWRIAPGLRLNLGYERVFGDFFGRTAAGNQFAQPFAIAQTAYAVGFNGGDSYNIGLEYTDNPNFQASARYEHRTSSVGSNTVITAGAIGKITPEITALLRYQQAGASNQKLIGLSDTANLKLGLAYRNPNNDKFNALLRYEYRQNPSSIPETLLVGSGTGVEDHTFALETIYTPNWRWEFYGKYALRHTTSYLASDLAGTSNTNLTQARLTYRTGYSTDIVGEARWINQAGFTETGFVVEAGYYLTPTLRFAAGYVFGKVDDRDFSGTRSAGGAYLGLSVKIDELFNGFGRQKVAPPQQQESLAVKLRRFKAEELNGRGDGEMGRWGDGEMGRWGDAEMGRWGDAEMGRWEDGEMITN